MIYLIKMGEITLILVIILRVIIPLSIFKWPLLGGFLSIAADASDVMLFDKFGKGPLTDAFYHNFDKFFDIYYLSIEIYVASKWKNALAKRTAQLLFAWRFLGFLIFESLTFYGIKFRPAFLIFPNIFENFFLVWILIQRFWPKVTLDPKRLTFILLIVSTPKMIQEYILHFAYQDKTWHFIRDNILFFLYK